MYAHISDITDNWYAAQNFSYDICKSQASVIHIQGQESGASQMSL